MLHHLDRLQKGHATTSRAIAGRCVHPLFSWRAIRQRSAFRLVGSIIQIWQQAFSGTSISLGAGRYRLDDRGPDLISMRIVLSMSRQPATLNFASFRRRDNFGRSKDTSCKLKLAN